MKPIGIFLLLLATIILTGCIDNAPQEKTPIEGITSQSSEIPIQIEGWELGFYISENTEHLVHEGHKCARYPIDAGYSGMYWKGNETISFLILSFYNLEDSESYALTLGLPKDQYIMAGPGEIPVIKAGIYEEMAVVFLEGNTVATFWGDQKRDVIDVAMSYVHTYGAIERPSLAGV